MAEALSLDELFKELEAGIPSQIPVMSKNNNIILMKLLDTGKELGVDAFEIIGGGTEDGIKNSLKFVRDTLREHG